MFGRPKNRRKPSERRARLPSINWRYLGLWVGALAAIAAGAAAVSWAFDQPIETVAVAGRFQRVTPVDVERAVKTQVHGAGLLSVDLAALLPGIHVPVYAINSDLVPTDAARIRKSIPNFTLDVLDHSGHFLMLEAPARFNPLLLKDLAALAAQPSH